MALLKKICMLGGFSVGKTSLVGRYVKSTFSEKYQTTVGVKIDKKAVKVDDEEITLMLWDIQGEDGVQMMRTAYLRGATGYIIVVDGTRAPTLGVAEIVQQKAQELLGPVPFIVLLNKADMVEEWQLEAEAVRQLAQKGWILFKSSAKTGLNVEEAFENLARRILEVAQDA